MSGLRGRFLSDRFFFVTARLLKRRSELRAADFHFLALAFRRARVLHPFFLIDWVFLPDSLEPGKSRVARTSAFDADLPFEVLLL